MSILFPENSTFSTYSETFGLGIIAKIPLDEFYLFKGILYITLID